MNERKKMLLWFDHDVAINNNDGSKAVIIIQGRSNFPCS